MQTDQLPLHKQSINSKRFQEKASVLTNLTVSLQYGEYELITFMADHGVWKGTVPDAPDGYTKAKATIDYGIYLYWVNTPSAVAKTKDDDLYWVTLTFLAALRLSGVPLPPSLMTDENYLTLSTPSTPSTKKLIYTDGNPVSTEPFEMFDPNWLRTLINLIITILFDATYLDGKFPTPSAPPVPITLKGANSNEVSLGLLSDWGAGTPCATDVINNLVALKPDYLVHLGDIYYSGTPSASHHLHFGYDHPGEATTNFLNHWPTDTYAGKSFTLNGNHEMYSGANGLFGEVLTHPAFSAQLGVTYFALRVGDWTVLCLDSAYYADPEGLYMYGSIGGATDPQSCWIGGLNLNPAKVIVMTHHNAFDLNLDDKPQAYYQPFWDSVRQALKGDPYAWYWGHAHNAVVYQTPVNIPVPGPKASKPIFTTHTYCRCIGHGSMPYGATKELDPPANGPNPYLWCAQYSDDVAGTLLPNGFVTVAFEVSAEQTVNQITERYYLPTRPPEPASTLEPVFTKVLFSTDS